MIVAKNITKLVQLQKLQIFLVRKKESLTKQIKKNNKEIHKLLDLITEVKRCPQQKKRLKQSKHK